MMTLDAQVMTSHTKLKYYADVQFETQGCKWILVYKQSFLKPQVLTWQEGSLVGRWSIWHISLLVTYCHKTYYK